MRREGEGMRSEGERGGQREKKLRRVLCQTQGWWVWFIHS